MAPKVPGSQQKFRFGRAIEVDFHYVSWVSRRIKYENDSGVIVEVEPRIIKLEADTDCKPALRKGDHRFWFTYWISTPDVRRRLGERLAFSGQGPLLSEDELLGLLKKAKEEKDFFSPDFWRKLVLIMG